MSTAETNSEDELWEAVKRRDARFDGLLFYGVKTTGVYCRPACASRLYESASGRLGMTPKVYAKRGEGEVIGYSLMNSSIGWILAAGTRRGLCSVRIGPSKSGLLRELRDEFRHAELVENAPQIETWAKALRDYVDAGQAWPLLPVDVRATAFQAKVWDLLRKIPAGVTATYSEIAERLGAPRAVRAVARACATNGVALAIPCHRVVPKAGGIGGYRWGGEVKQRLLEIENASGPGPRRSA